MYKNEKEKMQIHIERSKTGIPALWECGGSNTNTGGAMIIGNYRFEPKKPLYIKKRGNLACRAHALIPIQVGDKILCVDHHRDIVTIHAYEVKSIWEKEAELEEISQMSTQMLDAAIEKCFCYHCREAMYVVERAAVEKNHEIMADREGVEDDCLDIDFEDLCCCEE